MYAQVGLLVHALSILHFDGLYQCLELVQITLPVIEITYYQGDYTTNLAVYTYIVTTTAYVTFSKRVSPYILSYYMLKKYT